MVPEIKAQWVAALRSGEYVKGRNHLQKDGKFCCLGVLCELAVKAGIVTANPSPVEGVRYAHTYAHGGDLGSSTFLPLNVMSWAGLTGTNPAVNTPEGRSQLSDINDGTEATFTEIADYIDASL